MILMSKQQSLDLGDGPDEIQKRVSNLLDALSDPDTQKKLKALSEALAKLKRSNAKPRQIKSQRKRAHRPGWVTKAVVEVMVEQAKPLHVVEVHQLVEHHVGEPVSISSVNDVLAARSSGPEQLFVRIARGRYVIAGKGQM